MYKCIKKDIPLSNGHRHFRFSSFPIDAPCVLSLCASKISLADQQSRIPVLDLSTYALLPVTKENVDETYFKAMSVCLHG